MHSRALGIIVGVWSIAVVLAGAYMSLSGGDRRPIDLVVCLGLTAIAAALITVQRPDRGAKTCSIAAAVLLLVLATVFAWGAYGTWGFYRAITESRAGRPASALRALESVERARQAPGVDIVVRGLVDARLGVRGLVWVGEGNVAFGLGFNSERLGDRGAARRWYLRSFHAWERSGVGVTPSDVEAAIARVDEDE